MDYIECDNCGVKHKRRPSDKNKHNFCSSKCYHEAMDKGITGRKGSLDEAELRRLYIKERKSLYEMSRFLGCAIVTVQRYMKRYGIERRQ